MENTYNHADTVNPSQGRVYNEYGSVEEIELGSNSNLTKLFFPVKSRNIQAKLTIPENAIATFQNEGTLLSLDNLVYSDDREFIFRTRYLGGSLLDNSKPVEKNYDPEETCLRWEQNHVGDKDKLFHRYEQLLATVIEESKKEGDVIRTILNFVNDKVYRRTSGPKKNALEILDEYEQTGLYEGNCTETETFTRWLFCVAGINNRVIEGKIYGDSNLPKRDSQVGHAWNEVKVNNEGKEFWVPLDYGTIPYLGDDSAAIYFLPTFFPKVVSKNDRGYNLFNCTLKLETI